MDPEQMGQRDGSPSSHISWSVESLVLNVYVHPDEPRYVTQANLVDHIGKSKSRRRDGFMNGRKVYLADFHDNSHEYRKKTLLPALNEVCLRQGFLVVSAGYNEKQHGLLRLLCSCGVLYQGKAANNGSGRADCGLDDPNFDKVGSSVGGERRASPATSSVVRRNVSSGAKRKNGVTRRPVDKADRCHFAFSIFWDERYRLWYFYEYGTGSATHSGHGPSYPEGAIVPDRDDSRANQPTDPTTTMTTLPPADDEMNDDDERPTDIGKRQKHKTGGNDDDAFPDAGRYDNYDDDESVASFVEENGGRLVQLLIHPLTRQERDAIQSNVFNNPAGSQPLNSLRPLLHEIASYCTTPEQFHECRELLRGVKATLMERHHQSEGATSGRGQT
jgi:hypothetical protein